VTVPCFQQLLIQLDSWRYSRSTFRLVGSFSSWWRITIH
jgi:hypothetical protein